MKKIIGLVVSLVIVIIAGMFLFLSGCTAASETPGPIPYLIAENNAFNRSTIRIPAGQQVSIVFENKDNIPHNFAIYESSEATQVIFSGKALPGPGTITYSFTAPEEPNYYYFQCDFHPSTMNGRVDNYGSGS